jgi:predicted GNAT family acetyltransferase
MTQQHTPEEIEQTIAELAKNNNAIKRTLEDLHWAVTKKVPELFLAADAKADALQQRLDELAALVLAQDQRIMALEQHTKVPAPRLD